MKTRAAILFLFVLVLVVAAGCATAWKRSGVSGAQLVTDTSECQAAATGGRLELQETLSGSAALLLPASNLDRGAFAACMRERGYEQGYVD